MNFNIQSPENIMILFALILSIVSYFLHHLVKTKTSMSAKETSANIIVFLVWKLFFVAGGLALQIAIFSWISSWVSWQWTITVLSGILCFVLVDLLYYFKHRYEHEWNILWAQHNVHHSSEEFNFSTSLRLPWVASYLNWFFFVPALLLGFSPAQVIVAHKLILVYQFFIHTEMIQTLGPLEKVLNTPSHHRVHHGSNLIYLDKNYAGVFIIWDKLFNTFIPETEDVKYGLTHPLNTKNPILINLNPWIVLFKKVFSNKTLNFKVLFQGPKHL